MKGGDIMEVKNYLTLRETMEKYNKTYTQIRYATITNRLKGTKIGWTWIYPVEHLPEAWPETPRKYKRIKGERKDE